MKIMLSNAPWHIIDWNNKTGLLGCRAGSRWPHMREYRGNMVSRYQPFPFFLATASAMLKQKGYEVVIHDSIALGETYSQFYEYIADVKPDLVFFEVSTPSINNDLEIINKIRRIIPKAWIVVGGLHEPVNSTAFLYNQNNIDFTIYGEYEHPLLMLCEALISGRNLSEVPNLVYREGKEICKTKRKNLLPMEDFPWPDRNSLPDVYYDGCGGMMGLELQVHASRGCPYRCNFCVLPQIIYFGTYRMRKPQDVIDEIKYNFEKKPYTHFYFDDDTINVSKSHFMELCKLIKENGLDKYPWSCMARGDLMDDEMLEAMKESGCYSIKYGIESFNQDVLKQSGKELDLAKNIKNIKKTEDLGIRVHLTYCLGMLGDTLETVKDTIRKSLELRADSRQYSIATPFVGSKLWHEYKKRGWLNTEDCRGYDANHEAAVDRENLPADELVRLKREADYLNKQQLRQMVTSQFLTDEFYINFTEKISSYKKILITDTSRHSFVEHFAEIMRESGHEVAICTNIHMIGDGRILQGKYDAIVVPVQTFTLVGVENIIKNVQNLSNHVIVIFAHAKIVELYEEDE